MCQFVPCEVMEVQGQWALISTHEGTVPDLRTPPLNPPLIKGATKGGVESGLSHHGFRVYLGLLKDVRIGDYLLVHGDMAINKIDRDEAETVLRLACA